MTLYSMLTNRLEFTLEVDGETRKLTRDELMSHAFSPQPELRAARLPGALPGLRRRRPTSSARSTPTVVRDWYDEQVGLRGYPSPIAVRNLDNDIPDRAVEVLLEVARENVAALPALLPPEGRLARPRPPAPLRPLRAARHLRPQGRLRRRRALGARDLRRLPPRLRRPRRAGVRREPPRRRDPQGQARRRLLLHRAAALHPLGAGQLRRPGARRRHPRPRARPRHPQHAGRATTRA